MDAKYYENKITEMLSNGELYKKIPENQDRRTVQKVEKSTTSTQGHILRNGQGHFVLTDFDYRERVFYGLHRIQKSKIIVQLKWKFLNQYAIINVFKEKLVGLVFCLVYFPICELAR